MNHLTAAACLSAAVASSAEPPFRLEAAFLPHRSDPGTGRGSTITHMVGGGVCVLDFDGDGFWDLLFPGRHDASGTRSRLFRGGGAPSFSDVTESAGIDDRGWTVGCAVADVDNDGDSDLYLTRLGRNALLRNRGDGTFAEIDAGVDLESWSTGAAFADLDLDGLLDLYVAAYIDLSRVELSARCSYFGIEVFCGPNGLPGARDALYRNLDGSRFADLSGATVEEPPGRGFSVLLVDLDSDRLPEIRVANDASMQFLFKNLGDFRFEDVSLVSGAGYSALGMEQSGMGQAAGDYDRDGDLDLYVTNFQRDYNTLFRNDGGLAFEDVTASAGLAFPTLAKLGWGALFLDIGNDGVSDLFVANGHIYPELEKRREIGEPYHQPPQLFLGDGGGGFREVSPVKDVPARLGRGVAAVDLDSDGSLDVVVTNLGAPPDLYRAGSSGGNWIRLRLAGVASNRDGIGSVARIEDLRRDLRTSDGFLGASEPIVHFGLGERTSVPKLQVSWPSGVEDVCLTLPPRRTFVVKEGLGCLSGGDGNE
jgi:hypothetical protein